MSPEGIDSTSFHDKPSSPGPSSPDDDAVSPFSLSLFPTPEEGGDGDGSEGDGDGREDKRRSRFMSAFGTNPSSSTAFRPDSISSLSLSSQQSDDLSGLFKHVSDLEKRNRDLLSEISALGRAHDEAIGEREEAIEELRVELGGKRKEEKEMRGKEKGLREEVRALEAETARLAREGTRQREAYEGLRRTYEEQLLEAQKMRDKEREMAGDMRALEETARAYSLDISKVRSLLFGLLQRG